MYRGQPNAVLMHVRRTGAVFCGLIGKHSIEREIVRYDAPSDTAEANIVRDDDYPSAAFICHPELGMIACVDGSPINAKAAMSRLHAILAHRTRAIFNYFPIREAGDLRVATSRFRVTQIDYDVYPVNPHTGALGLLLDENRKQDHIQKMAGKLSGSVSNPIKLNGGFATQIQELQTSGHSRVGFTARTNDDVEIKVPKPPEPTPLDGEDAEPSFPEVRISFPGFRVAYPPQATHIEQIVNIMEAFAPVE
jgi:hypothetical protein